MHYFVLACHVKSEQKYIQVCGFHLAKEVKLQGLSRVSQNSACEPTWTVGSHAVHESSIRLNRCSIHSKCSLMFCTYKRKVQYRTWRKNDTLFICTKTLRPLQRWNRRKSSAKPGSIVEPFHCVESMHSIYAPEVKKIRGSAKAKQNKIIKRK